MINKHRILRIKLAILFITAPLFQLWNIPDTQAQTGIVEWFVGGLINTIDQDSTYQNSKVSLACSSENYFKTSAQHDLAVKIKRNEFLRLIKDNSDKLLHKTSYSLDGNYGDRSSSPKNQSESKLTLNNPAIELLNDAIAIKVDFELHNTKLTVATLRGQLSGQLIPSFQRFQHTSLNSPTNNNPFGPTLILAPEFTGFKIQSVDFGVGEIIGSIDNVKMDMPSILMIVNQLLRESNVYPIRVPIGTLTLEAGDIGSSLSEQTNTGLLEVKNISNVDIDVKEAAIEINTGSVSILARLKTRKSEITNSSNPVSLETPNCIKDGVQLSDVLKRHHQNFQSSWDKLLKTEDEFESAPILGMFSNRFTSEVLNEFISKGSIKLQSKIQKQFPKKDLDVKTGNLACQVNMECKQEAECRPSRNCGLHVDQRECRRKVGFLKFNDPICETSKAAQNAVYSANKAQCEAQKSSEKASCEANKSSRKLLCEIEKSAKNLACRTWSGLMGDKLASISADGEGSGTATITIGNIKFDQKLKYLNLDLGAKASLKSNISIEFTPIYAGHLACISKWKESFNFDLNGKFPADQPQLKVAISSSENSKKPGLLFTLPSRTIDIVTNPSPVKFVFLQKPHLIANCPILAVVGISGEQIEKLIEDKDSQYLSGRFTVETEPQNLFLPLRKVITLDNSNEYLSETYLREDYLIITMRRID